MHQLNPVNLAAYAALASASAGGNDSLKPFTANIQNLLQTAAFTAAASLNPFSIDNILGTTKQSRMANSLLAAVAASAAGSTITDNTSTTTIATNGSTSSSSSPVSSNSSATASPPSSNNHNSSPPTSSSVSPYSTPNALTSFYNALPADIGMLKFILN